MPNKGEPEAGLKPQRTDRQEKQQGNSWRKETESDEFG